MRRWIKRVFFGSIVIVLILLFTSHVYLDWWVSRMPGESFNGEQPPLDPESVSMSDRLQGYVEDLSYDRSVYNPEGLKRAADYVREAFIKLGVIPLEQSYRIDRQLVTDRLDKLKRNGDLYGPYEIEDQLVTNFWIQIPGTEKPGELLIISAHYDTVHHSPGAADDAAGIAGVFEIARHLLESPPRVSVLLAVFTCEEYPVGTDKTGGSFRFADFLLDERLKAGLLAPIGMISLDTLGNFTDVPGSQVYPSPLGLYYPDQGNFVAFVGDGTSRAFVRKSISLFREVGTIPSEGAAIPTRIVRDVARSDHEPFIRRGVPGLMMTDTANFRVPNDYHKPSDTPDRVDYANLTRIIRGGDSFVLKLAMISSASQVG